MPDREPLPVLRALLLWFAGMDLRLTLLALPPLLPIVHRDLRLSEAGVAALANAPVLVLASSSMFGALIVARLGARGALLAGTCVIAIASAFRGFGPSIPMLFAMTVVMGAGIALIQPAFPVLARAWFPTRIALASGIWTNGLLMGEALPAALTLPFVLPFAGSWEATLVAWSVPVGIVGIAIAAARVPSEPRAASAAAWLPDFRLRWMWRLGIFQSAASLAYFGANTFIPDYLTETNQAWLIAPCLSALNVGQLPASFLVGFVPLRILAQRGSFWTVGVAIAGASAAFLFLPAAAKLVACVVIALAAAYILSLGFGLPSLVVAEHGGVARVSAGSFTIGYAIAFFANLLAGGLWDVTHLRAVSFAPIVAAALVVIAVGPGLGKLMREATSR